MCCCTGGGCVARGNGKQLLTHVAERKIKVMGGRNELGRILMTWYKQENVGF